MWSWLLHRVTGVGVLIFLLIHILDTAFLMLGPELYNRVMALYRHPLFLVGEVVLVAMVLYHALNGVRIIIVDFWPESTVLQREMFYTVMVLFEDENGELDFVAGDDDSGHDTNARFNVRLKRGRKYQLRIRLYYSTDAGFTFVAMW